MGQASTADNRIYSSWKQQIYYQLLWLIGKDSDAGRDWGQEEKGTTEDEMAGWHHQVDAHEFGWTPGGGDGQGGLACCDSCGRKEWDTTEWLNWTELIMKSLEYLKELFELPGMNSEHTSEPAHKGSSLWHSGKAGNKKAATIITCSKLTVPFSWLTLSKWMPLTPQEIGTGSWSCTTNAMETPMPLWPCLLAETAELWLVPHNISTVQISYGHAAR